MVREEEELRGRTFFDSHSAGSVIERLEEEVTGLFGVERGWYRMGKPA